MSSEGVLPRERPRLLGVRRRRRRRHQGRGAVEAEQEALVAPDVYAHHGATEETDPMTDVAMPSHKIRRQKCGNPNPARAKIGAQTTTDTSERLPALIEARISSIGSIH